MRGRVDAARGRRRVPRRPGRIRDVDRLGPAGEADAGAHVTRPARARPTRRPSAEDCSASRASWTPRAPSARSQGKGVPAAACLEEQLPLHLEAVVEHLVIGHLGPLRRVVDGVGQVRVPYRHGRAGAGLHGAVPQARDRAPAGAVDLQFDQLTAVHPDGPGGVDRRDRPALELQQRVGGVVGGDRVGAACLVPALRDVRDVPCVQRRDRAEQVLQQVLPVREHVQHDPAAVLAAVVPGRPLGGHPVSLEDPVAELEPGGQDLPEEALADEPPQLDHAGQEELVLDHPVDHPGLAGLAGQPQGTVGGVGQRLLRVDVLARGDGLGQAGLARAGDLRVEVHADGRVGQHLVQAGGPALQPVPFGDLAQPVLAAPDQDRFRAERRPVLEGDTALVADAQHGTHQVLAVAHPAGDPVHGHMDYFARHQSLPGGSGPAARYLGKGFPRLGWPGKLGQPGISAGSVR